MAMRLSYRLYLTVAVCMMLLLDARSVFAQTEDLKNSLIEQRIEDIAASLDEGQELDYTNLFEDLAYYYEHPLNLNNASIDELRELYMLTDVQIANLERHIERYGPLRSLFELQAVDDFDLNTIRIITPFITVKPTLQLSAFSLKEFFDDATHDLFIRYKRDLQLAEGFQVDPETGMGFMLKKSVGMNNAELKEFLDIKVIQYNTLDFIDSDPIQIPHLFTLKEDIEIAAFLTATIAWGNRKMIINNSKRMMDMLGNSPYDFIMEHNNEVVRRIS